ncbi:MAG: DNA topoisomerase IV subunit A [Deltaproteobacteria bacterium]|nr:DNA topoisomerase IV subunit A [Deltaproteobacteria bacterium]MBT6434722.1 DNA topoisomerase IV subunit A [Deltaproteobacteria bacterium]
MSYLEPIMQQNFLEYASYVVVDRAIPDVRDGCKPVQRRILHTLFTMDDGKFHKVANVIGESMKLHPHGDASIANALVVLANKDYFIEKQGNFGNVITGHSAAASRYIECRLTPLARETVFNKALTTWEKSYDGRRQEPIFLPAKLPIVLMLGIEGIAVGMATKVLPHNFCELLRGQIKILQGKPFRILPDFQHGGIVDVSEYDLGRGKVRVRAKLESDGEKRIFIREIPYSTTTESLIASIESAAQKNKVKISSINDFTTDKVEIELILSRGVYADDVIQQLYAYTDCEVSITSNIIAIEDRRPVVWSVNDLLRYLTAQLREQIKAELNYELSKLADKHHWMTLEQIFIENKVYKALERVKSEKGLKDAVYKGMAPFAKKFVRPIDDDDVKRLLALPIRRISAFDIEKHRKDVGDVLAAIKALKTKLRNLTKTTITYLEDILARYGKQYKRRTKVEGFETVDKRAVASQNIKLNYDKKSGFFGSSVKGKDLQLTVSEYDVVLVICADGTYSIMTPQEKVLLSAKILYCEVFDPEEGVHFTVVYRDAKKIAYAKRIHIHKFIRNKQYRLVKDAKGRLDVLLEGDRKETVDLTFTPAARQRVKGAKFKLSELEMTAVTARGIRLAPKPVSKISVVKRKSAKS